MVSRLSLAFPATSVNLKPGRPRLSPKSEAESLWWLVCVGVALLQAGAVAPGAKEGGLAFVLAPHVGRAVARWR